MDVDGWVVDFSSKIRRLYAFLRSCNFNEIRKCALTINLMGTCCHHSNWNLSHQLSRKSSKTLHDNNHEIR